LFPGGDTQFALPLACPVYPEQSRREFAEEGTAEFAEGVDEIPPDDVPIIVNE